jgi:hypothetical protein
MRSRYSRMPEAVATQDGVFELRAWRGVDHAEAQRSCIRCVGTPWLRDNKDTPPRRISPMRNVGNPLRSARGADSPSDQRSQLSTKTAQVRGGTGRPNKQTSPAERHGEHITRRIESLLNTEREVQGSAAAEGVLGSCWGDGAVSPSCP